jgi:ArsR family transcriptional regulator, arsenate/arsenite/antimonite-responsive transcriptional repressor / arsenate reductase (thioredoxin)
MDLAVRAAAHAALGDARRLAIVDRLTTGDLTVAELAGLVEMTGNLLAHHLDVLEEAGVIERRVSEGDHRRRYVSLRWKGLPRSPGFDHASRSSVAFVCTHNSARSQFAAALWESTTGRPSASAGRDPADRVHPTALRVASEFGIDLISAQPAGYDSLPPRIDLVVSVCDRARESGLPPADDHLHWSVPDPVTTGTVTSFRAAFTDIARRVERLAGGPA